MKVLLFLSDFIIPLTIFYVVGYGFLAKRPIYDDFIKGAKKGMKTVLGIMPTLIGLMMATSVLRASGFLDYLSSTISMFTDVINVPGDLIPLIIIKMFSSSAATGLLLDIFKSFGPDSFIGRAASIMMGCTETIFYTMSVYFMSVKIKKTRYTLAGALLATLAGVIASVVIAGLMQL